MTKNSFLAEVTFNFEHFPHLVLVLLLLTFNIYFRGRNFREQKLLRMEKFAKFSLFANINFREWAILKNFANINFRESMVVKDFASIKFRESLKVSLKVGLSPSKKILFYLLHWKPFKNDEKYFLFHLKSSFRSQGI